MLSMLIFLLMFLNCSTSYSEEINISSNKKKNTDISVHHVRFSPVNPSENLDAGYGVNLHLKESKMYAGVQPHTREINNSSDAEDRSKTSEFHSFQGKNKEKPKYLLKKINKLNKIHQNNSKQRDFMPFDMPKDSTYCANTTSILKKQFEESNINPNFNSNDEENGSIQNITLSTSNTIKTYSVYSISEKLKYNFKVKNKLFRNSAPNLELGEKRSNNSVSNFSLKRKNTHSESESSGELLDLSMKTVQEKNSAKPKTKRICARKELSNLMTYGKNEGKIINYTILLKYSNYIAKIECLLKEFLMQNKSIETDINKLVYGLDLLILQDFSSDIFGEWNMGCTDILQKVSMTADMVSEFIDFCKKGTENKLFSDFKSCLNEDIHTFWTDENIPDFILSEIKSFLKSEESKYFKSIYTEFYSFVDLFDNLAIKKDFSLVNAFAVFLLMVKRNSIIIYQLKENLLSTKIQNNKGLHLIKEKQNSSALLFVFLDNLNFSSNNFIITNMRTSILYKCISNQFSSTKKKLYHIRIVSILSNFFFYLIDFNIFLQPIEILKYDFSCEQLKKENQQIKEELKKIKRRIKRIEVDISSNALKITEKMNRKVPLVIKLHSYFTNVIQGNNIKTQTAFLNKTLDLIYTFINFKDCNIHRLIMNTNAHLYDAKFRKNILKQAF